MNNCASLLRESQVCLKWEGAEDKISVSKETGEAWDKNHDH